MNVEVTPSLSEKPSILHPQVAQAVALFSAVPRTFLSYAAKMGCAAGCANSSVHEPELKGPKGAQGPQGLQRPKVQHGQGKPDFIELKSKTEDLKFRIFEVAGPGSALYQPYLGFGLGYNSWTYSG